VVKAVYTTQQTITMYYEMQFAPFLTTGNHLCLTEPYYQAMLRMLAPYVRAETRVLDVGCGLGRMVFELAQRKIVAAVGIDTSDEFISICQEIAANEHASVAYPVPAGAPVSFLRADAQALPFSANTFNCMLCLNLIDRVPHPKTVIAEITRVLSPAGLLLISDPYEWEDDRTEPSERIDNMNDLFPPSCWEKILEEDRVPFSLLVYDRKISTYANHTLLLRKR
jgi:ubiquinone/menaquinone biosynthesis C-methylase UbiE